MLKQFKGVALKDGAHLFGLRLRKDQTFALDLLEAQAAELQKSVDAGDVSVEGMKAGKK